MKIKLRLILVFAIILSTKFFAANFKNLELPAKNRGGIVLLKSTKNNTYKRLTVLAAVNPPVVVAGSSCGPGVITLSATGVSGDTIEWFSSQTSPTVLATGTTYSPNVSVTTTYYVSARSGLGTSIRVPVVASVYNVPPTVTLSSVPANNTLNPLCLGTSITFTANGGADLFEFSVNGVVVQSMSSVRTYTTSTLTSGQVVSVKSRYAVALDGNLTENAWGTGPLEDNVLSASLSGNAANGYINALKISPTEDKLVFGIAGKAINYRRIMVFLDTKPGGFNVSNYGDENTLLPVRAFNYFNNNPSTFDSYFFADYCLAIATDKDETSYYADVIELKTGNSTKTYLGSAATGSPSPVMGANKNNTGTSDYNLGFEVEVSKALVGYTSGDVKFFAFTMQDNTSSNYNVTNSFLSPATRTSDYGSGAIDYNLEAPNPVVVAESALTPCYSTDSMTMNFASNPTVATVGGNQSRCSLTSAVLGGNTPSIGVGVWSKKSGPGTVIFSDSSLGNATATVSTTGTYVFTWTISSGQCSVSSADITVVYNVTDAPTGSANQNFCKINNPKVSDLVATGNNIEWFTAANGGTALSVSTDLGTGPHFAEQTNATTSCKSISRLQVNVIVDNPTGPAVAATQTFCNTAKVSDLVATGTAVKWYAAPSGGSPLDPNTNLVNGETYYATQTVTGTLSCESIPRIPSKVTINVTPKPTGPGSQIICNSGTVANLAATGTGIKWYANATGGSPLLSSEVLVSGTTYYASQTIGTCESATRYAHAVIINNPVIPVSGGDQLNVCATNPLQTLTATATVSSGTIVWYDSMTNGNVVTSPVWNSVGSITYYAQNNIGACSSVSRTAVTLEIKDSPFLNVTTKTCSADLLSYTVDFTVASGSVITRVPAVGVIVGNSITNIPAGTNITINADKGNGCVESFIVTAPDCNCAIINNPINSGNKSICEGKVNPTLSATVNAGETIDWYSDITGGVLLKGDSPDYEPTVVLPGVYTYYAEARKTVDGCLSSGRTPVSLNITSQSKPTGSAIQVFCESQSATVGNLIAIGTGIQWYADATGGADLPSGTFLVDSEDYYASQKATTGLTCESLERLMVTVVINKPSAPTGPSSQVFCNSATVADLQVTGSNIKWYDSPGTLLTPSSILTDGVYSATQTVSGCESVLELNVTVTINKPSAITISGSLTFCESENATVASLTAKATSGTNIQWYSSATGNTPLLSSTSLIEGSYYGSQTVSGCESTPRVVVDVAINAPSSPTGDGIQLFCSSQSAEISNLVINETTPITWYDAAVAGNPLLVTTPLVDGTKYYAAQNVSGCESVNRLEISVVIVDPLTPTIATANPLFCESQNATLNSIVLNGIINNSNIIWYDALNGGTVLPSNTLIVTGGDYYAVQQSTTPLIGCESINRLTVSPVLDKQQPAIIDSITQPTCAVNTGSILFSGLPTTGNWTIIPSTGTPVIGSGTSYLFTGLAAASDYTFKVSNANGCTSVASTSVAKINAIPTAPLVPTVSNSIQPTCAIPSGTIVITPQQGMEYSLDGINYQSSTVFEFLPPNDYMLYVRNTVDASCSAISASASRINNIPTAPIAPTVLSIVQPTCMIPSGTVSIAAPQTGMEYSLDGITYQLSNVFNGLVPNDYMLYVRNTADATCLATSASATRINTIPTAPTTPTSLSVVQPTCAVPSGSITVVAQIGTEYSLDGTTYQLSNVFNGLVPNDYALYVRNIGDATCMASSLVNTTIDAKPLSPVTPTLLNVIQPTCSVPFGTIEIGNIAGVEYSIGKGYQDNPVFLNLAPDNYKISVRYKNNVTCETFGSDQLISAIPPDIQFESSWTCQSNKYELTAIPLSNSYDPNAVEYVWKDQNGNTVGANSNVLNVNDVVDATAETETFPLTYSLTIQSNDTGCETTSNVVIESIYCDIQKGISPDGNGSNDFLDLRLLGVKKLEMFNRYGIQVYSQSDYTNQWSGQTNNGEALPSATYYYVIEFNNGQSKTGWIYLIR